MTSLDGKRISEKNVESRDYTQKMLQLLNQMQVTFKVIFMELTLFMPRLLACVEGKSTNLT